MTGILSLKVPNIILEFAQSLFKALSPIAIEKAGGILKDILKLDTSSARETIEDDQLYNLALLMGKLSPQERSEVRKFRSEIKEQEGDNMETAFVLYIASFVARFSFQQKDVGINYNHGIEVAVAFLKELLVFQTFKERLDFLKKQSMDVLIKEERPTLKKRTLEILETAWPEIEKRLKELLGIENFEEVAVMIDNATEKVRENRPPGGVVLPKFSFWEGRRRK